MLDVTSAPTTPKNKAELGEAPQKGITPNFGAGFPSPSPNRRKPAEEETAGDESDKLTSPKPSTGKAITWAPKRRSRLEKSHKSSPQRNSNKRTKPASNLAVSKRAISLRSITNESITGKLKAAPAGSETENALQNNRISLEKETCKRERARKKAATAELRIARKAREMKAVASYRDHKQQQEASSRNPADGKENNNLAEKRRLQPRQNGQIELETANSTISFAKRCKQAELAAREAREEDLKLHKSSTTYDNMPSSDPDPEGYISDRELPSYMQKNPNRQPALSPPAARLPGTYNANAASRRGKANMQGNPDPHHHSKMAASGYIERDKEPCAAAELKDIKLERANSSGKPSDCTILGNHLDQI